VKNFVIDEINMLFCRLLFTPNNVKFLLSAVDYISHCVMIR